MRSMLRRLNARRLSVRRDRLDGAGEPGPIVDPPAGARPAGELLWVVDGRWWCKRRRPRSVHIDLEDAAVLVQSKVQELAPEFAPRTKSWPT